MSAFPEGWDARKALVELMLDPALSPELARRMTKAAFLAGRADRGAPPAKLVELGVAVTRREQARFSGGEERPGTPAERYAAAHAHLDQDDAT